MHYGFGSMLSVFCCLFSNGTPFAQKTEIIVSQTTGGRRVKNYFCIKFIKLTINLIQVYSHTEQEIKYGRKRDILALWSYHCCHPVATMLLL
jgi:hypothetical protein